MLKTFLNNYFGFNKQQRNGLYVLLLVCFALLVIRIVYPYFIHPDEMIVENLPLVERKLDSASKEPWHAQESKFVPANTELFKFDPNSVSKEQLIKLGFREKTAQTFLKFRDRGFVFRKKRDLLKIYGVSEKMFIRLEPYIVITPESKPGRVPVEIGDEFKRTAVAKPQIAKVELNSADSAALEALPGLGPSYARRILKYRSLLGGYANVEQLKEVYGLTEELFIKVEPNVFIASGPSKLININTDAFKTLNRHPYVSYELTKTIFDWRRKTKINAVNLKEIVNNEALYNKLLPYLSFD